MRESRMNAYLHQTISSIVDGQGVGYGDDNVSALAVVHLNAGELNRLAVRVQLSVHFVVAFAEVHNGLHYTCFHDPRERVLSINFSILEGMSC